MLLPHKPKQTYKFKTKNQPLLQKDQWDSWRRKLGESCHNLDQL